MTTSSMLFALNSFGEIYGRNCHAMLIGLIGEVGSFDSLMPPIFIVANGITLPISRGRPPSVQA